MGPRARAALDRPTIDDRSGVDAVVAELLPAGALAGDRLMRQRITVRWDAFEESFDVVVQKRGDELVLLGLGPMDRVGFTLILDPAGVRFENRTGRELPFAAEYILADVQRVFYPWLDDISRCVECRRTGSWRGLDIEERIGTAHLVERRFSIRDEPDRAQVVIGYEQWSGEPATPTRVTLENGWFGYDLTIETQSTERID